jgi:N-methylhydantoinase A
MGYSIGIDVGGTFTDFLLVEGDQEVRTLKVLSTPDDPSIAVIDGLASLAEAEQRPLDAFLGTVERIVHGTTVTTNAVLTGNTVATGLITTRGFRDAIEMRRGIREVLYDNKYRPPKPLVPRPLRLPVSERIDAQGNVLAPIDLADVETAAETLAAKGIEAIAVSFLHSHMNDDHERRAARFLRQRLPGVYLSVSSELLPQVRFYERTSTTVLNAAVGPLLRNYLDRLTRRLDEAGFGGVLLIMQSNGGVASPEATAGRAASTLLSGPAAGPIAGKIHAARHGASGYITIDMGGTSFEASLVQGEAPAITTSATVERHAMALPTMDIKTIGAGGGSIGRIDSGGLLRMGPESAGAAPGPACYGLGGDKATCSDANLVLGYLSADFFAGGRIKLDSGAAKAAIERDIARRLGLGVVEAAAGMFRVMNVNMAAAIRAISVERGHDPRDFPLICAGGAGAIHAAMIALELGIQRTLVPREASIFCAAGMLRTDLVHDYVRSHTAVLDAAKIDHRRLISAVEAMESEGHATLDSEGIAPDRRRFRYALDLRYRGQYHEVRLDAVPRREIAKPDIHALASRFHRLHDRLYGYDLEREATPVELVSARVTAVGITEKPVARESEGGGKDPSAARKGSRPVYLPNRRDFAEVSVYDGDRLAPGNALDGPAIVETETMTTFVPDGFDLTVDAAGAVLLTAHIGRGPQ